MNINRENIDELNAIITLNIEKDDYSSRIDEILADYKKKVKMDGFRPGKVPIGLVRKLYYKQVLVEEVNKLISESLTNYIFGEKLKILGDPLPAEKEKDSIDWNTQTDFTFNFEVGVAPEFELSLSGKDKITFYSIKIDNKMKDSYVDGYARQYGSHVNVEEVKTGEELLSGSLNQTTGEGDPINVAKTSFSLAVMKDEKIKKAFMNAKAGDSVKMDLKKAFPNDTELASILQVEKEEIKTIEGDFIFKINEISSFVNAEINQELFDKAFGKDKITSNEEFENEIKKEIQKNLDRECELRFTVDARDYLINKLKLNLPEKFLFKWLVKTNEGKYTEEEIKEDFEHFTKDLVWQLIKEEIVKKEEIKIEDAEVFAYAREVTMTQFMQYGLAHLPDDQLDHYARELVDRDDERKKLVEKLLEDRVVAFVKNSVKIDNKSISAENFNKLYEKK